MKKAVIIGGGVIGGGWAARFLLNGWNVGVYDPDPETPRRVRNMVTAAGRSLPALYDRLLPEPGHLEFHGDIGGAVRTADWVQESVAERIDLKHSVLEGIRSEAPATAIVASSTSGFKPSDLNAKGGRAIVAHPFNPVYLLPLVELVGDPEICARAEAVLTDVGMRPLTLRREIDAHIADRLLEAVWREALWLVKDGIATTAEIDDAIRMGFGLRWAQMGLFETYRIAGGEAGIRHFLAQFGPALAWPWSRLTDVPEYTPELVELIAAQSDAQSGGSGVEELERRRDNNLVGILRALRKERQGAGQVIAEHEARLPPAEGVGNLPTTVSRQVPQSWTDYNGHMNEAHYLEIGAQATDRFMELIGAGPQYVSAGHSFFTVENHLVYLDEVRAADRLDVTTQVLGASGKTMHLFHRIKSGEVVAATMETMLVHVDLDTRRSSEPSAAVAQALLRYAEDHASLPRPAEAGRAIGCRS